MKRNTRMQRRGTGRERLFLLASLLALAPLVTRAADTPNAGSILQQVQPAGPPSPASSGTGLTIKRQDGAKLPPGAPFEVKVIRITGNSLFDTASLLALVQEAQGKSLTLTQLDELAGRLSDYYRSRGYPLSRAVIPAQVIRNGEIEIKVIEARYGKVGLDNRSSVSAALLQGTLATLQSGQAIGQDGLDHALLLLSDIPGVAVDATLKPGEAVGTSDLSVEAAAGPAISGTATLDGYGNRYTGRARIGGSANVINPLHHGDVLSLSGLTSGSGLNYARIAYDALLNGLGTHAGAAHSDLRYALGGTLASISANGTARVDSLWGRHPLVRSRNLNLQGDLQYDRMQLRDHIDSTATRTDRHLGNWIATLSGDARDPLLSGGYTTWSASWTAGRVAFDDTAAQLADAGTAVTQGGFSKWNASLTHLRYLNVTNALYFAVSGQWANSNLDAAKKLTAGGPYTVRAYDMGAVSGDAGYVGTAEWRHDLGTFWQGQWQSMAFIDSAHVTVNKTPWTAGANGATLSGAGAGLSWAGPERWSARIMVAAPIGSRPLLVSSTASARAWIEVGKAF
jgi:hemolysin activation/secretion protein